MSIFKGPYEAHARKYTYSTLANYCLVKNGILIQQKVYGHETSLCKAAHR